ncbi:MAG: hypothetical protein ACKO6N_11665 [Myxococcota bacterium]
MSSESPVLIIALLAAAAGIIFAFVTRARLVPLMDQVSNLEGQLRDKENRAAGSQEELGKAQKEIQQLKVQLRQASERKVEPVAPKVEVKPEKRAKHPEKEGVDPRRLRELEEQLNAERRKADKAHELVRLRDQDVQSMREQLESLQRELEDLKDTQKAAPKPEPEVAPEPEPVKAPVADGPSSEVLAARVSTLEQELHEARRARSAAIEQANKAELEFAQRDKRIQALREQSKALASRVTIAERERLTLKRKVDASEQMYKGLKGRYEVARDTLFSFRERFGVELPVAAGVPVGGDLEAFLEPEEEEDRSRPRARMADDRGPRPPRSRRDDSQSPVEEATKASNAGGSSTDASRADATAEAIAPSESTVA